MSFKHPQLAFYHRNEEGTGAALVMELYPAYGTQCGFVKTMMAGQMTTAPDSAFNWKRRVGMNLGAGDIMAILAVLDGVREDLPNGEITSEGDGRLYSLRFERVDEVKFLMEIIQNVENETLCERIILDDIEGNGLRTILSGCLHTVVFGK